MCVMTAMFIMFVMFLFGFIGEKTGEEECLSKSGFNALFFTAMGVGSGLSAAAVLLGDGFLGCTVFVFFMYSWGKHIGSWSFYLKCEPLDQGFAEWVLVFLITGSISGLVYQLAQIPSRRATRREREHLDLENKAPKKVKGKIKEEEYEMVEHSDSRNMTNSVINEDEDLQDKER
jgi:hypothetical protein